MFGTPRCPLSQPLKVPGDKHIRSHHQVESTLATKDIQQVATQQAVVASLLLLGHLRGKLRAFWWVKCGYL